MVRTRLGTVLLLTWAILPLLAPAVPVRAMPPPPPPHFTASIWHLIKGAWAPAKLIRLGEEVRFQVLAEQNDPAGAISAVEVSLQQTSLGQDGYYRTGGTIYQAPLPMTALPDGTARFAQEVGVQDSRLIGRLQVTFTGTIGGATHGGSISTALTLLVKPAQGEIQGGNPRMDAYWGLDMSVSLPAQDYPKDALVDATVRIVNHSKFPRTFLSAMCGTLHWVQVLDAQGQALPPITFPGSAGPPPPCRPGSNGVELQPGSALERHELVVLAGSRIRVGATIGDVQVHGPSLTLQLASASPPQLQTKESGTSVDVHLQPREPGTLRYGFSISCGPDAYPVAGSGAWLSQTGQDLHADRPSLCDPEAPWQYHAVAGWLGYPVARIDVTDTKPVPCDPGRAEVQPVLPDISAATQQAVGITLLPPPAVAKVCRAEAIYADRSVYWDSPSLPAAVLAQVRSDTDPLVDGHLAWALLVSSPIPNDPQTRPILLLSFVDATSGQILDTVYAGGLHPPGPPIHLQTVGKEESESIILSATTETPPVNKEQAIAAMQNAPGGDKAIIREAVLARAYSIISPLLRDRLVWIFSVAPPGSEEMIKQGGYWVIYIDAETGKMIMAGGTPMGNVPAP